jgi:hypothetical protein
VKLSKAKVFCELTTMNSTTLWKNLEIGSSTTGYEVFCLAGCVQVDQAGGGPLGYWLEE